MTARVYAIASGKGGTGKTTTTLNLGVSLAMLGKKTIIVDADLGMANLGLLVGLEKNKTTLHEVLSGEAEIKDAVYNGPSGLRVVPSGLSLNGFQKSDPDKLKQVIPVLADGMDYVLIDAPGGISKESIIPLAVADRVLLVVNPELSSIADALKTKKMAELLGKGVEGIILNRAELEKTEISCNKIQELLGVQVLETIPEDANVRRSAAFKIPVVMKTPSSPASIAFKKLAAKIAGEKFTEAGAKGGIRFVDRIFRIFRRKPK